MDRYNSLEHDRSPMHSHKIFELRYVYIEIASRLQCSRLRCLASIGSMYKITALLN